PAAGRAPARWRESAGGRRQWPPRRERGGHARPGPGSRIHDGRLVVSGVQQVVAGPPDALGLAVPGWTEAEMSSTEGDLVDWYEEHSLQLRRVDAEEVGLAPVVLADVLGVAARVERDDLAD